MGKVFEGGTPWKRFGTGGIVFVGMGILKT